MVIDGTRVGIALAAREGVLNVHWQDEPQWPGSLQSLVGQGARALQDAGRALARAPEVEQARIRFQPPLGEPQKIVCIGLNYADHSSETGLQVPSYPTVFGRFASSLVGHGEPIRRPRVSTQLDYEGELVAVIGTGGRDISKGRALNHVIGYSVFNDASVRDYQMRTPQWTVGKNFDATGAFGPFFVTADELPAGAAGLSLTTRLNGRVVQQASTTDMIFDVATQVSLLSEVFTWQPGDIIVTGTPAGVGMARKPPLWMASGDVCEVEVEGVGLLRNPIADAA
ncbi:MAG: fumarylacetoacetate hydrolase family protein [Ideonella sp.]|nr:fumarylacetoacetate hydrolase family protein [Ideonella sp.]